MPLRNPDRRITEEVQLAQRVAYEREQRGWTYKDLAERMADAGYKIQPSAIYKVEKEGRRVVVEELVAYSRVFGIPVDQLLLPAKVAQQERVQRLWREWKEDYIAACEVSGELQMTGEYLMDALGDDPALLESIWDLASQEVVRGVGQNLRSDLMPEALADRLREVLTTFPVDDEYPSLPRLRAETAEWEEEQR